MRAARTPPDPAPITRRSTSCAAITTPADRAASGASQIVTPLLHFVAEPCHHLVIDLSRPGFGALQALVDHDRLLGGEFLADRGLIERDELLELGFGELLGIEPRDLVDDLIASRRKFGAQ